MLLLLQMSTLCTYSELSITSYVTIISLRRSVAQQWPSLLFVPIVSTIIHCSHIWQFDFNVVSYNELKKKTSLVLFVVSGHHLKSTTLDLHDNFTTNCCELQCRCGCRLVLGNIMKIFFIVIHLLMSWFDVDRNYIVI